MTMAGPNNGSRKMSHVTTSMEELMSSEFCNKKFQFELTALVQVRVDVITLNSPINLKEDYN